MKLFRNPWNNGKFANHPCFCQSGKKLKKCHGRDHTLSHEEMQEAKELFAKWEESPAGLKFYQDQRPVS